MIIIETIQNITMKTISKRIFNINIRLLNNLTNIRVKKWHRIVLSHLVYQEKMAIVNRLNIYTFNNQKKNNINFNNKLVEG